MRETSLQACREFVLHVLQEILGRCKAALEAATDSLLEKETLSGSELEIILQLHPEESEEPPALVRFSSCCAEPSVVLVLDSCHA